MIKRLIEKLKSVRRIRTTVRKIKKLGFFFINTRKRKAAFIFHSTATTLRKSLNPFIPSDGARKIFDSVENNELPGISVYRDVLSYPIKTGREKEYSGGLINRQTHQLIERGIHIGNAGQFTQELPPAGELVADSDLLYIEQPVLFGGILFHHFGHFLLESLGRLWAYDRVKKTDPFILFYIDNVLPSYLERTNFIYQALKGFNIPHEKLLFINQPAVLKMAIVPEQKYGFTFRQDVDTIFIQFIRSLRLSSAVPKQFKNKIKLYVSRTRVSIGKVIGEQLFEKYLHLEGYTIFHPELYTLHEQLAIYQNAEKIIFCDGSAIHACILLPDLKAGVVVIARRWDRLFPARDILFQFKGYGKKALWIDCIKDQYQFGLQSWHALTIVDWYEVSNILKNEGFVHNIYSAFHTIDFPSLLRVEMSNYLEAIKGFPEYAGFMINLKEQQPAIK